MDIEKIVTAVKQRLMLMPNLKVTITGLDDEVLTIFAKDAITQALSEGFTEVNVEMGAAYLTAHFCNVVSATNTNVSKQQASVLSIEYFDRAGVDDYLLEYQRLQKALKKNIVQFL